MSQRLGCSEWYLHDYNPIHSFIPTFSALAYLQPNQNWNTPLNFNLKCPSNNLTPFDSYFGSSVNTQHTSFTKESVEWLLKELAGQPQAPYFPIQANEFQGPNIICANTPVGFGFPNPCKIPSTVTWSVQGDIIIVSSTEYNVIVKGGTNNPSEGKIIATFQNGQKLEKIVHIGNPKVYTSVITGGFDNVPVGSYSIFNVASADYVTSYEWSVVPISSSCISPDGLSTGILPTITNNGVLSRKINWGYCTGTYIVRCIAANSCGNSWYNDRVVKVFNPVTNPTDPCVTSGKLIINPNPSKAFGDINVNIVAPPDVPPCNNPTYKTIKEIKIYDLNSNLLYSNKYDNLSEIIISRLELRKGYYIMFATTTKDEVLTENFLIEE